MTAPQETGGGAEGAPPRADVRLSRGRLAPDELAAIAVVVSAMSVTSRLEAQERALADGSVGTLGLGGASGRAAWSDAIRTHPRGHALRGHAGPGAWLFADR